MKKNAFILFIIAITIIVGFWFTTLSGQMGTELQPVSTNTANGQAVSNELQITDPVVKNEGKVFVLCYHTFHDYKGKFFNIEPWRFEEHLIQLKKLGYTFVSFGDIVSNRVSGDLNVLITIDDGDTSVLNIQDILKAYNIRPIYFISSHLVNITNEYLTFSQIATIVSNGGFIGGHSQTHTYLKTKLYKKDKATFSNEIVTSKFELERDLHLPIPTMAYPYGECSPETLDYVGRAGYDYAFTTVDLPVLIPLNKNKSSFKLPRFTVARNWWKTVYAVLKKNSDKHKKPA